MENINIEWDTFYKKLHKDDRFPNLVKKIESDIGASTN